MGKNSAVAEPAVMSWASFKKKWKAYQGKESSAYQEHFNDLCRLLNVPTPAEADPTGSECFCFQKRVVKDAELLMVKEDGSAYGDDEERGFADVWYKDHFAWEYKGKKKDLREAHKQLLRYRESLLNPPLLVVCDFDRYIIRTNFTGTVQEIHEFTNDQIDEPRNLAVLRALFTDPEYLKPQKTTAQITEALAAKIAEVARSLQSRECIELADAKSRKEVRVAEKQNLRIARFLNRIIFCFFAEDVDLLPKGLFTEVAKAGLDSPEDFAEALGSLFQCMAHGGRFGVHKIRHFNGHLFDEATVFELTLDEIKQLAEASEADWQSIEPSIMGTLFERALDDTQRARLGAHYTSEADIKTLVEPVLMMPLRREWTELKRGLARAYVKGKASAADRTRLENFHKKLSTLTVLDPACGSGNFLYVSLQLLLGLEKELLAYATQLGFKFRPQVGVHQLKAIEINPYAYELAQVSVQIGYLQWMRDNGFNLDRSPVLQVLDGFRNEDALLVPHYRNKAKSLKEARDKEHAADNSLIFYTERDWPECDVIVGNPPFLGGKLLRSQLGDYYVDQMFDNYDGGVPREGDLCCYWFEKARRHLEVRKCRRAGLLATQGIRGGANREVLKRIKDTGDIFFAESDRDWILNGATVHVSMVAFDRGEEKARFLNGNAVPVIHANLTASVDITSAVSLTPNLNLAFMGTTKGGAFDISEQQALDFLHKPNPHGKPNSDVVVPWVNGMDLTQRSSGMWIVDYGLDMPETEAAKYEAVFEYVRTHVRPQREQSRTTIESWWLHERRRGELRAALAPLPRFICTTRVSKHRLFVWLQAPTLPDSATFAFARSDDYFFGILHSRFHEVWARAQGTQLREKESGFRYTPTTCFETFPLPVPTAAQEAAIAAAAKELNELRERWLNPPEWTREEVLEFPASATGPWSRYVQQNTVVQNTVVRGSPDPAHVPTAGLPSQSRGLAVPPDGAVGRPAPSSGGIGIARYPRRVPKDAAGAQQLKERTLTNLYNQRPAWLDLAHKKLDAAVAAAYGFPVDLTDDQILERLLALNLERAAAEAKAAAGSTKPKTTRAKRDDELI